MVMLAIEDEVKMIREKLLIIEGYLLGVNEGQEDGLGRDMADNAEFCRDRLVSLQGHCYQLEDKEQQNDK